MKKAIVMKTLMPIGFLSSTMQSIILIGLLCFSVPEVLARGRVNWDPTELEADLSSAAEELLNEMPVSFNLDCVDNEIANWSLSLDEDEFTGFLSEQRSILETDLMDRLVVWSRWANKELGRITRDCFRKQNREHFNYETDCSLNISGQILPASEYYTDWLFLGFSGSRMSYVGSPDEADLGIAYMLREGDVEDMQEEEIEFWKGKQRALQQAAAVRFPKPDPPLEDNPSEITYEINPSSLIWNIRENITGNVTLRNTGTTRIHVGTRWEKSEVNIRTEEGSGLEAFYMQGCILWGEPEQWNTYLLPGDEITSEFTIHTDPSESMTSGYIVPDGRFVLSRGEIPNVLVRGSPITIEIRRRPGEYVGPRILWMGMFQDRLVLHREDDLVDVVDLVDEERIEMVPRSLETGVWRFRWTALSPDGTLIAERSGSQESKHAISLEKLLVPGESTSKMAPPDDLSAGQGGFLPMRFSGDGDRLFAQTNFQVVEFDVETGDVISKVELPAMWPEVSPDGQYLVELESPSLGHIVGHRGLDRFNLRIMPWNDPEASTVKMIKGMGEWSELYLGKKGVYLWSELSDNVLFQPYDGSDTITYQTGPASFLEESDNGEFFVCTSPFSKEYEYRLGTTGVAVWSTMTGEPVCEFSESMDLRPMLVSSRDVVVCAVKAKRVYEERVRVYDLHTGEFLKEVDLTPGDGDWP